MLTDGFSLLILTYRAQLMHESGEGGEHMKPSGRLPSSKLIMDGGKDQLDDAEKGLQVDTTTTMSIPAVVNYATSSLEKGSSGDPPRFSIFGVARIQRTRLLASLSGLKLEAEITNLQATCSYKKKFRPLAVDLSLTGNHI